MYQPEQRRTLGHLVSTVAGTYNSTITYDTKQSKICSLNIKEIILKTVLLYSRNAKIVSVICPALINHSFRSKWEIFWRKPISKTCKASENTKQDFPLCSFQVRKQTRFPFVFFPSTKDTWTYSCLLSSWENGIPLNTLFKPGGKKFQPYKREARSKAC